MKTPVFCSWNGKAFDTFKLTSDGRIGKTTGTIADIPSQ